MIVGQSIQLLLVSRYHGGPQRFDGRGDLGRRARRLGGLQRRDDSKRNQAGAKYRKNGAPGEIRLSL
jgi:hypothetical protein